MIKKIFGYSECMSSCNSCNKYDVKNSKNGMVLVKKKVSKHFVPPDMQALKLLVEDRTKDDLMSMSDSQLVKIRDDLLQTLLEMKREK